MNIEGSIRLAKMFCAAHDRNVPILFRHRKPELDPALWSASGEPVACLDFGVRCNGWLCPHFAVPKLPDRGLVERAMNAERVRGGRGMTERRAILERALREEHIRASRPFADSRSGSHDADHSGAET